MSFKPAPQRLLRDIVDAIEMIEHFTSGMDFKAFRSNPMAVAAVERKIQIISDAAIRPGDEAERLCPDQPWRDVIWNAVTDDLPPWKVAVIRALSPPAASPNGPPLG